MAKLISFIEVSEWVIIKLCDSNQMTIRGQHCRLYIGCAVWIIFQFDGRGGREIMSTAVASGMFLSKFGSHDRIFPFRVLYNALKLLHNPRALHVHVH